MADAQGPKVFPADEPLYRVLEPEFWIPRTRTVHYTAFLDEGKGYARLSVYFGSKADPRRVLAIFSQLRGIRRAFNDPSPEDLWRHGYGVGRLTVGDVLKLGLGFEKTSGGAIKYKSNGHVNIMDGQKRAADLSSVAIALSEVEIFP